MANPAPQFRVLGPLEVESNGERLEPSAPRQRALLSLFLMHPGEPLSVDRVIDALWGEQPPSGGAKTVGFHLSKLRDSLEPARAKGTDGSFIRTTRAGYVLDVDPATIDSERFESLLDDARAIVNTDPGAAAALARDSIALWRGPAHADVAYEQFAQDKIRRLEERRLEAIETRIEADLSLGRHAEVVVDLEGLVERYPLREGFRSSLMLALYRAGRQADALRAYETGRRTLADELGIDPSRQLQDLERRILEQDESLELATWAVPTAAALQEGENPYKGLRAFDETDAGAFFGRSALVADLTARLTELGPGGVLTLVGPSGSGKSSALSAGLLPVIRRGELPGSSLWVVARLRPGRRPMEELEVALHRSVPNAPGSIGDMLRGGDSGLRKAIRTLLPDEGSAIVLLVIDQFEELWTVAESRERAAFLAALAAALEDERTRLVVVSALRSDFLGEPMRDPWLAERLRHGTVLVPPLTSREIEEVVRRPAEGAGVAIDPELTAAITNDLRQSPGALPLLQYALTRTFDTRAEPSTLTRADYESTGGIESALADGAEQAYQSLTGPQRKAARQIFLRLIAPGHGSADTRRRVPVAEIESLGVQEDDLQAALRTFDDARLLTFDSDPGTTGATVEVAHESLLTAWERMRSWISEARDDLAGYRLLEDLARDWDEAGRDPDSLLTGSRLARFAEFADESSVLLTEAETEFITESARARDEADRRRRQQRQRAFLAVSAIAVVAIGLAVFAFLARNRAGTQARQAESRALIADAYEALETDPELALYLAAAAAELDLSTRAAGPLQRAINAQTLEYRFFSPASALAVDPTGRRLATLAEGGFLEVRDLETGAVQLRAPMQLAALAQENSVFGAPELELPRVAFDDTGSYVFGVSTGGEVVVVAMPGAPRPESVRLGRLGAAASLQPSTTDDVTVRVSEDAGFAIAPVPGMAAVDVVAGDCSGQADLSGGEFSGACSARFAIDEAARLEAVALTTTPVAVTSATHFGDRLLIGTSVGLLDREGTAVNGRDPTRAAVVAGSPSGVSAVSADNRQITITFPDGDETTVGGEGTVRELVLNSTGTRLAAATDEGTVVLWETATGRPIASIPATGGLVTDLGLSDDGALLVVAISNQVEVHRLDGSSGGETHSSIEGPVASSAVSIDGTLLAVASEAGSFEVIETATGQAMRVPDISPTALAFDEAGLLLAGTEGGDVVWLAPPTWTPQRTVSLALPRGGQAAPITSLAAGQGPLLAYSFRGLSNVGGAGAVSTNVVDTSTLQLVGALEATAGLENLGSFSPPVSASAWYGTEVFLTGSSTGGIRGRVLLGDTFQVHAMRTAITQLLTSSEAEFILASSSSGSVAGIEVGSNGRFHETVVDPGGVFIALDPRGRWFATAGAGSHRVELHDLESGELIADLWQGPAALSAVWFTPDGSQLGFLDHEGRIDFVSLDPASMLEEARRLLIDIGPPDPVECATYFGRIDCADAVTLP